ncbi:hypothetical protein G4Y79_15280 [Phototrophicus methaneseepsis]|uniref:Uncharacterized protein n=1 Tax=Phototrophicus methaneseepsis TaxID=2710758 RepID=A0A7S8E659_9CHLR|nr:hypothetical protein [Phototrophicus methaneseepsis]QPC81065.1 hypothetical protein G4Y79_15280 [Phototrophicus methaneseepsis]
MPYNQTRHLQVTPPIDTNAYTANDVVGGLLTFGNLESGGGGTIRSAYIVDTHSEGADLTLYLFRSKPSTINDDAAFAPTADDLKKLVAIVAFAGSDFVTLNSMDWQRKLLDVSFEAGDENALYGYLVDGTGGTWAAANNLTIGVDVWAD